MEVVLKYPVVFLAAGFSCWVLLAILARVAGRLGLVDAPRERHIHREPVPLIGGLALAGSFFGVGCALLASPWAVLPGSLGASWFYAFFLVGGLFVLLGALDDRHNLRAMVKLGGQIAIALVAYALHIRFSRLLGFPLPAGLDMLATIIWFLAFVNAFNLIDGMDGVATGITITGVVGLMIFFGLDRQPLSVLMLLVLLGGCLVFLRYNFHPAHYFLGDAGSMFLGAFFASVSLGSNTKSMTVASLGLPLLVAGVPLLDSLLAIWRRLLRRVLERFGVESQNGDSAEVMSGDLDHLHHRLEARGYSQRRVALILYAMNALLVSLGLIMAANQSLVLGMALLTFLLVVYLVVSQLATLELELSGQALIRGWHRPDRRATGVLVYPLFDAVCLLSGSLLALFMVGPLLGVDAGFRPWWLETAPFLVGGSFAGLFGFGVYRRIWSRARVTEYVLLYFALAAGSVAGVAVLMMFRPGWGLYEGGLVIGSHLFFCGGLLVGGRAFPRVVMDVAVWKKRRWGHADQKATLVYGAGMNSTLMLREMAFRHPDDQRDIHVVGYIDDNPILWQRIIFGLRVLGGLDQLCAMLEQGGVRQVVVTCDLEPERWLRLTESADRHGVAVEAWKIEIQPLNKLRAE